jgi:CTP synthase
VVCDLLRLETGPADVSDWRDFVDQIERCDGTVRIGLVGKYVQLHDAYLSVSEALRHAAIHHGVNLEIDWIDAEDPDMTERLNAVDGILVPGGFGSRGIEGKIDAVRHARETDTPFLGVCLGMQVAIIEFARHVANMEGANSTEFDPETPYRVIDLLPEQQGIEDRGGTMRLGADPVSLVEGTRGRACYGDEPVIYERHRHRYEVNPILRAKLEDAGLVVSGHSPNARLVEMIELPHLRWFCASQFHPEFKSRPTKPAPLFRDFIGAAVRARLPAAS